MNKDASALIDKTIKRARRYIEQFNAIAVVGLFSGGHDSLTANLIAHEAGATATLHVDTGIGIDQTRDFVRETAEERDWKLRVFKATENVKADGTPDPQVYEDMVRSNGFPGPIMHRKMYSRLKERQLERFEREIGATPERPVLYLSGCRADESVRRMGNTKSVPHGSGRRFWFDIIHDFTKADCSACIKHCGARRNDVVDLIHKSGECLCGAYAQPGELDEIQIWFPDVAKRILTLQAEVWDKFPWKWEHPGPPIWWQQKQQGQTFMLDYDDWSADEEQPLCRRCNMEARLKGLLPASQ